MQSWSKTKVDRYVNLWSCNPDNRLVIRPAWLFYKIRRQPCFSRCSNYEIRHAIWYHSKKVDLSYFVEEQKMVNITEPIPTLIISFLNEKRCGHAINDLLFICPFCNGEHGYYIHPPWVYKDDILYCWNCSQNRNVKIQQSKRVAEEKNRKYSREIRREVWKTTRLLNDTERKLKCVTHRT